MSALPVSAWPNRKGYPSIEEQYKEREEPVFEPVSTPASIRVRGTLTAGGGTIEQLEWVHGKPGSERKTEIAASLIALDAKGGLLTKVAASRAGQGVGPDEYEAWLKADSAIERIVLRVGDREMASRSAPRIEVFGPRRGSAVSVEESATASWRGSDADGDRLLYVVEKSFDEGQTWHLDAVTRHTRLFYFDRRRFGAIIMRVTVTDGFFARAAQSGSFELHSARHRGPQGIDSPLEPLLDAPPAKPYHHTYTRLAKTSGSTETGWLISTDPEGAKVTLDGRSLPGVTPLKVSGVAPVMHVLRVELPGRSEPTELAISAVSGRVLQVPLIRLVSLPDDKIAQEHRAAAPWVLYGSRLADAAIDAGGDQAFCNRGLPYLYTIGSKSMAIGELNVPDDAELFSTTISGLARDDCFGELAARADPPDAPNRDAQLTAALGAGDATRCRNYRSHGDDYAPAMPTYPLMENCFLQYARIRGKPEDCFAMAKEASGNDQTLRRMARCAYDLQAQRKRFEPSLCERMHSGRYKALCMHRARLGASECAKAFPNDRVLARMCEVGPAPLPKPPAP